MSEADRIRAKLLGQIIGAIEAYNFTTPSQINGYLELLKDFFEGDE